MAETLLKTEGIFANYETEQKLLDGITSPAFKPLRDAAFREYIEFGIPTRHDEEFKYLPLRHLSDESFQIAYGATVSRHEITERVKEYSEDFYTLTFVNGEYAPELSHNHAIPDGVFIGTLEEGLLSHDATILHHLTHIASLEGQLGSTNDERFHALNSAHLGVGGFVFVPKGVAVERPIHILNIHTAEEKPFTVYPRVLVVVEEQAQIKLLETFTGFSGNYFSCPVTEIEIGANAIVEHNRIQTETMDSTHVGLLGIRQEGKSVYTSNSIQFGGRTARIDLNVQVRGEHAETWLNGVVMGVGDQTIDNHTRIDHMVPNCNSFEVYKTVLADRSHGVFNGKIFVYQDAQKTDAKQTNQTVLLSAKASMDTKPQLEIFADDVKCTHGATIGKLRDDALFYLRARGIPKAEAEALLVYAFAAEVFEKITIPQVKEVMEAELYARLSQVGKIISPLTD